MLEKSDAETRLCPVEDRAETWNFTKFHILFCCVKQRGRMGEVMFVG